MQQWIHDVKVWMSSNKLKLNGDKTEPMILSSQRMSTSMPDSLTVGTSRYFKCHVFSVCQNSRCDTRYASDHKNQVINLVRSANFELRRINSIRHYLSVEATQKLVFAFVISRLDLCKTVLYGWPQYLINRLQKVQNNAAHLILKVPKTDHIMPHLQTLHWLPVDSVLNLLYMPQWYQLFWRSEPCWPA